MASIARHGRPPNASFDRHEHVLVQDDRTSYIHLRETLVVAAGTGSLPVAEMHWRGRLSEVSGWSFGHLGAGPPTAPNRSNA